MTVRGDVLNVIAYSGSNDSEAAVVWLDAASAVVDARLGSSDLGSTVLARIEEHLAAHYVSDVI
jgi:hypothetical protein